MMNSVVDMKYMDWKEGLEPSGSFDKERVRVLLVGLSCDGYYSLPVRILALSADSRESLKARYDIRFVDYDLSAGNDVVLECIESWSPQIVAFSVNVWSRDAVFSLVASIKKLDPSRCILAGGQEMTNSVVDYLEMVPALDYIIDGEGEIPFGQFLDNWDEQSGRLADVSRVTGLHYRHGGGSLRTGSADIITSLDEFPSPILMGLVPLKKTRRLGVLLEGTRGCPYRCSFCFEAYRSCKPATVSMARLRAEIEYMQERGAVLFHMMDPILCNSDSERLREFTAMFAEITGRSSRRIVLSVEAYGDHLTKEMVAQLGDTTIVDIGLQSTNPKTIKEIHRHYSEEKFSVGIRHLMEAGLATNVYLIPGLPYETFSTALRGVCFLINQRPTRIFLNELCLLNGTELRERAEEYGYEFDDAPPYYVKSSRWISAPVLSILCRAAKDLVRRYNLSFASLSLRSKVLQDYNNMRDGVVVVNLGGGCGWSCSGCRDSGRRDSNDPSVDISELCSLSMGKDVEIVVGDYIELQVLLNVAAQFQLSGAQRIKLVAPLTFFRDIDDITKMVNTGIWHYRTFVGSICGDVDNIVLDFHKVRESIQLLGRKFKVNGFGVRPHLEVVLLSSEDDVPELQSMIEVVRKEAESIAMPSLAGDAEFLNGLFADAVTSEEVKELVKSSAGSARTAGRDYWPKVSETAVRQVFNESEDLDLVCKYLEDLDLLSDGHVCPPCFRAVV